MAHHDVKNKFLSELKTSFQDFDFPLKYHLPLKYFAQTFEMVGKFRTSAVASFFKNCTIRKIRQQIGDSSSIKKRRRKNQIYCYAKKLQKQNRIFFCKARQNGEKKTISLQFAKS